MEITIQQLQQALARCLAMHPTDKTTFALHPDASRIADLFGEMQFHRLTVYPLEKVKPKILEAFNRWNGESTGEPHG